AGIDMHLWLDPENGWRMAERIGETLAAMDPANAAAYRRNVGALRERLVSLDERIARRMAGLAGRGFIVFHDGYRYFEDRYGLVPAEVLTVNPEASPGADRVRRIRSRILEGNVGCLFIEPQFPAAIAGTLVAGTAARIGRLDRLGPRALRAAPVRARGILRRLPPAAGGRPLARRVTGRGPRGGQAQDRAHTPSRRMLEAHFPAVEAREVAHDGQAEAASRGALVEPHAAIEDGRSR